MSFSPSSSSSSSSSSHITVGYDDTKAQKRINRKLIKKKFKFYRRGSTSNAVAAFWFFCCFCCYLDTWAALFAVAAGASEAAEDQGGGSLATETVTAENNPIKVGTRPTLWQFLSFTIQIRRMTFLLKIRWPPDHVALKNAINSFKIVNWAANSFR